MSAAKLLDALEDNLTVMISLVVKLKRSHAKKNHGKVIYLKMVQDSESDTDTQDELLKCAEEE